MVTKLRTSLKRFRGGISFIIFVSTMLSLSDLWSQGFNIYNPAEMSQPWVSEINPAVISSQYSRISLGLKVFHFGFLPGQNLAIKESHINASFPFYLPYEIGIGGDLRYFSAGIYSELTGAVMLSKKVVDNLSFGMKIGIGRFGFSRQDFNLVDANDPLLSGSLSKTSFNLGLGGFWNSDHWAIGLGVDHANRPNIGRQTNANLPMEITTAVGYKLGRFLPTLLLHHDGTYVRYGLAVSVEYERFGMFRLSFEKTMPFKMELQFNITRDNSLQYGFDLPNGELSTVSMGTHEIVFNHIFGRGPDIGQPEIRLSSDTMRVFEQRIVRSMPRELLPAAVEKINELEPAYLEASGKFQNRLVIPTGVLSPYESESIRQQRYVRLGKEIKFRMQQYPDYNVLLQTDERSLADARAFRQYLIQKGITSAQNLGVAKLNSTVRAKLEGFLPGQENASYHKPTLSVEKLSIAFDVPGKRRQVKEWELTIINDRKEVVRIYTGKDRLPELMEWDWKDKWGELATPGRYSCSLHVDTMSGQKKMSSSQPIEITRLNRTVILRFSQEPKLQASKINP